MNEGELAGRLAERLRAARQAKGLSLEAAARLSGVSRSMISQIERGESSPTVATLWNLTRALQVDFAGLLQAEGASSIAVVHGQQAPVIRGAGEGVEIRILSAPEEVGVHEIYEIRFAPGAALLSSPHRAGCREHVVVQKGSVEVVSGPDRSRLGPDDAAAYPADRPHALHAGPAGASLMMIVRNS